MCSEYRENGAPVGGLCDIVDGKKLKPGTWYIVENMKWVEVDFTDNIFSYVLSTKGNIKKVKRDSGEVNYIVTDGNGNYAHGETIKEAKADLVYKITNKFDGTIPGE